MAEYQKYLISREAKPITLDIMSNCSICGVIENAQCRNHDSEVVDQIPLVVKQMPWALRNQKISLSLSWDSEGHTRFDGNLYLSECLKYMIVEAPWGKTDDIFLIQVGNQLGHALEKMVPKAFGDQSSNISQTDLKKV